MLKMRGACNAPGAAGPRDAVLPGTGVVGSGAAGWSSGWPGRVLWRTVFFFIVASGAGALGLLGEAAFFLKKVWFCQVWRSGR